MTGKYGEYEEQEFVIESKLSGAFERGEAPLNDSFPLSFQGEEDTGGEVNKK